MARKCVLIVARCGSQEFWLADTGWQTDVEIVIARDAANGVKRALINIPDIVILDVGLAEREAMVVYQQMSERLPRDRRPAFILKSTSRAPVVITTEGQTIPEELMAKVESAPIANSNGSEGSDEVDERPSEVSCHGIDLDFRKFSANVDGSKLDLTATEFRLLWTLASHPGCVFTRRYLADACHGSGCPSSGRSIDVHIRSIRRKLQQRADVIETVWGVGYRFRDCQPAEVGHGRLICAP